MLILGRRCNETVILTTPTHQIKVVVVDTRKSEIRLGFITTPDVAVHRGEIHEAILAEGGDPLKLVNKKHGGPTTPATVPGSEVVEPGAA